MQRPQDLNCDVEAPKQEYPNQYTGLPSVPLYPVLQDDKSSKVKQLLGNLNNHIYGMNILSTFTVTGLFLINPPPFGYVIVLGTYFCIVTAFSHFESVRIRNTLS